MFPARFEYVVAESFLHASEELARAGDDAKLLAGGCSLVPLMKLRLAEPRLLVDLTRVDGGAGIGEADGWLEIGALTREAAIEESAMLWRHWPILVDTSSVIADPLVRNMGTVGGNLAHADPANDHPAAMLALGATIVVQSTRGRREIAIDDFFQDLYQTALAPDEVLTAVRIPAAGEGTGSAYVKLERQVGDFAVVGAGVTILVVAGVVLRASIGLTNVGPVPVRARAAESALVGRSPADSVVREAAAQSIEGLNPWSELRGSTEYKLGVLPVIVRRAIERALARVPDGPGRSPATGERVISG